MSRGLRGRLERLEAAAPARPPAPCAAHARLCPAGHPRRVWAFEADDEAAALYEARHGAAFHEQPCEPGDPADAEHRLLEAGILHVTGPGGAVLHVVTAFDLTLI